MTWLPYTNLVLFNSRWRRLSSSTAGQALPCPWPTPLHQLPPHLVQQLTLTRADLLGVSFGFQMLLTTGRLASRPDCQFGDTHHGQISTLMAVTANTLMVDIK